MPLPWTEVVCVVGGFLVVHVQLRTDGSKRHIAEALFLGSALVIALYLQLGVAGRHPGFPWLVGLPGMLLGSAAAACANALRSRRLPVPKGGKQ